MYFVLLDKLEDNYLENRDEEPTPTLVDVEKIVTIGLISAEEVSLVTLINGERFFVNHDYREIEHYILDALN